MLQRYEFSAKMFLQDRKITLLYAQMKGFLTDYPTSDGTISDFPLTAWKMLSDFPITDWKIQPPRIRWV